MQKKCKCILVGLQSLLKTKQRKKNNCHHLAKVVCEISYRGKDVQGKESGCPDNS